MIEEIERQGMNAVCVFSNGMPVLELGMPSLIKIFEDYFVKWCAVNRCFYQYNEIFVDRCTINDARFSEEI